MIELEYEKMNRWVVLEYLRDNPVVKKYKDIAKDLNYSEEAVKKCILRFRYKGWVDKIANKWIVNYAVPVEKSTEKQEIIKELIEELMESFRDASNIKDKIRIAEIIINMLRKF